VERAATLESGQYVVDAWGGGATTAVMYKYSTAGVPTGMYVWMLSYAMGSYTATPMPQLEDLLTYHGFSVRIVGKAGIRFKTGISSTTRAALISGGIPGYTLSEYGTLVMNNANRPLYPFVKDGEKVAGGLSYGRDGNGALVDAIYELESGRYRYTSVLVGLPAAQYKTEFAFRGYIVLRKNGTDVTLYGPPVSRSIYTLAQQILAQGDYPPGSGADLFLRQLILSAG
jgi:hypothetical protein